MAQFYLQGHGRVINPQLKEESDRVEGSGQSCLCYLAGLDSIDYWPAQQRLQGIQIYLEPAFLDPLMTGIGEPPLLLQ